MGKRDENYQLSDQIELDEGFFSTIIPKEEKDKPLKRGRGSQKKTKVLVMTESSVVDQKLTKKGKPRRVGFIKMQVIDNLEADTITSIVKDKVTKNGIIDTDDSTSYVDLKKEVKEHNPKVIPKEKIGEALPWVHLTISNAKRLLLDLYHGVKPEFLQNYLNEFCYKFNRRYYGEALFERLLMVSVSNKNLFRYTKG
jgi:transposase-like protein